VLHFGVGRVFYGEMTVRFKRKKTDRCSSVIKKVINNCNIGNKLYGKDMFLNFRL